MTVLADNITELLRRSARQGEVAKALGVDQSTVSRWATGTEPKPEKLLALARYAGATIEQMIETPIGKWPRRSGSAHPIGDGDPDATSLVDVEIIDLAFGLGSTVIDADVETESQKFGKGWIALITKSPPNLLTWTRGRGDSMLPTIDDGDLILLDRSQTRVTEQDALWAFTVGDTASIKRLRVKGDRYQILSDNPSVPPDEEPIDFVRVVARVVFVGKRK